MAKALLIEASSPTKSMTASAPAPAVITRTWST
jgi:hypothetical protein